MQLEFKNENWEIKNLEYFLDESSYNLILKTWKTILKPYLKPNLNILIINGGDQTIKNAISTPSTITICDNHAYDFVKDDIKNVLNTEELINHIDSLGYKNKLYLLDMNFLEAIEDQCFKEKFDIIIIANSYLQDQSDITSKLFLEYCYYYLKDRGLLFLQLPKHHFYKNIEFKLCLDYYFSELNKKLRFLPSLNDTYAFASYIKFSSLV